MLRLEGNRGRGSEGIQNPMTGGHSIKKDIYAMDTEEAARFKKNP